MLDFCGTTALEVLNAAIAGKPCWVPKTHWSLHTEFILKGTQRRGSVVGPVAPSTASQSILFSRDRRFKKNGWRCLMGSLSSGNESLYWHMICLLWGFQGSTSDMMKLFDLEFIFVHGVLLDYLLHHLELKQPLKKTRGNHISRSYIKFQSSYSCTYSK